MSRSDDHTQLFPYDQPYDHQAEAMDRVRTALEDGQDVLFEGACGTGKTLASLVPALDYARETDRTVVITTNVHQQMRQFIEEARAITRREQLSAVVFRGKGSMCHIDVDYEECQTLRDATRELVDVEGDIEELKRREEELLEASQDGSDEATKARGTVLEELEELETSAEALREERNICERYYDNLTRETNEFYAWLYDGVRTPEEIYDYAESAGLCGYELLKEGMEGIDLVICNYHHLLDPMIREQFFRWLGRDPDDIVAVFDEAHNVADAARDHATRTLTEQTLDAAIDELEGVDDTRAGQAANVVETFRDALVETYEDGLGFGDRETLGDDFEDITIDDGDGKDDLTLSFLRSYSGEGIDEDIEAALSLGKALDRRYDEAYKNGETTNRRECQTLSVASFLETWMAAVDDPGRYPVVGVRRTETGVVGRAELYTCLPQQVTGPLFSELHATVLMSATLRPFDVTEDVLGLEEPVTMAYGEQFPAERRRTLAVDTPALFASRRDDATVVETVSAAVSDVIEFTPGNTLVFFPSYAEAERYYHRYDGEATPFLDEPGVRAEEVRQSFTEAENGVLFTSLWGTLAEGVSFDGDDARSVAVVGVPYPHLDDRLEAVQGAYEGAFEDDDAGWRYAVEIPTVRKTRQALGRVVRSPTDFGARILIDERYTGRGRSDLGAYSVHDTFPAEEREELIDVEPEKLRFALLNFFADLDGYDGEPPRP
ncbi:MAG: ATP-dependent DNA helicase [Natronomonas sp.]